MRHLVLLALAAAACFSTQAQTAEKPLTFDAASIKPFVPPTGGRGMMMMMRGGRGGPGSNDPGRVHYPSINLKTLLTLAYDIKDFQISGPSWLDSERFEIQATMPPETTKEQFRAMLQNLLAERFQLKVHRETKDLPMYSMVVAKGGPKMKESVEVPETPKDAASPEAPPPPPLGGRGPLKMVSVKSNFALRPVASVTGRLNMLLSLSASASIVCPWASSRARPFIINWPNPPRPPKFIGRMGKPEGMNSGMMLLGPPPGGERARDPGEADLETPPTIYAALQSQLGLKLEPKKGPVDLLLIDHMEKTPTEN